MKDLDAYARLKSGEEQGFVGEVCSMMKGSIGVGKVAENKFVGFLERFGSWGRKGNDWGEEKRVKGMLDSAKKEYGVARTSFSDAVLVYGREGRDGDEEGDGGGVLGKARRRYEMATARLLDAAAGYEGVYRDGLIERVRLCFKEERGFLKAMADSLEDVAPITDCFSTDVEDIADGAVRCTGKSAGSNATHAGIRLAAVRFGGKRFSDVSVGSAVTERRTSDHLTKAFSFGVSDDDVAMASARTSLIAPPAKIEEQIEMERQRAEATKSNLEGTKDEAPPTPDIVPKEEKSIQDVNLDKRKGRRIEMSPSSEDSCGSLAFNEGRNRIELVRRAGWNAPHSEQEHNKPANGYREIEDDYDDVRSEEEETVVRVTDLEKIMI